MWSRRCIGGPDLFKEIQSEVLQSETSNGQAESETSPGRQTSGVAWVDPASRVHSIKCSKQVAITSITTTLLENGKKQNPRYDPNIAMDSQNFRYPDQYEKGFESVLLGCRCFYSIGDAQLC